MDVDTISAWLDGWEREGLLGLYDEPRSLGMADLCVGRSRAALRLAGGGAAPDQTSPSSARAIDRQTGQPADGASNHQKKPIAGNGTDGGLKVPATKPPFARRTRAWASSGETMLKG